MNTSQALSLHALGRGPVRAHSLPLHVLPFSPPNLNPNVAAAARVAPELSSIKSPSNLDVVLVFLASALELSPTLIAVVVARDPTILTCSVPRTLASRADELRALGFTTFQNPDGPPRQALRRGRVPLQRARTQGPVLVFLRGRVDKLVVALEGNPALLDKLVVLLQEEGTLTDDDAGWFAVPYCSKLLTASPGEVDAVLVRADEFSVPRKTRAFKDAVVAAFSTTPERLAWKAAFFRDELGWTEAQVKMPTLLTVSAERLRRNWCS